MTLRLACQIPQYGGSFIDKEGVLNVYLTNLADSATAGPIVQLELNKFPHADRTIRFLKGEYTYNYLASLEHVLLPYFAHGISLWTVDERRNRFLIGVVSDDAREKLLLAIDKLKLPLAAIIIEKIPYAIPV